MPKSRDAFRTISEVSDLIDTPAHVLRFWESKFSQIKPVKRAGGRRYYRPQDIDLLSGLKNLLHEQGMTIKAAQKLIREKGIKHVAGLAPVSGVEPAKKPAPKTASTTQTDTPVADAEIAAEILVPLASLDDTTDDSDARDLDLRDPDPLAQPETRPEPVAFVAPPASAPRPARYFAVIDGSKRQILADNTALRSSIANRLETLRDRLRAG